MNVLFNVFKYEIEKHAQHTFMQPCAQKVLAVGFSYAQCHCRLVCLIPEIDSMKKHHLLLKPGTNVYTRFDQ